MLNELLVTATAGLAACVIILMMMKSVAQITPNEAKVMWTMHRQTSHCRGRNWQPIKLRKDKIVGFQCECGYQYTQKRPLICGSLKRDVEYSEQITPSLFEY
jgi:hypothetical protein